MKKGIIRFISTILVFTLIISNIPISSAYSISNSSYLEAIREAMNDASLENPAGNWGTAIFKDGLHWGVFHYAVQNHIIETNRLKYRRVISKEFPIELKNGKNGRADLAETINGHTYLWEVKPLSYAFPPKIFAAVSQLAGYVNSNPNYRYGNTGGIDIQGDTFSLGKYQVTYVCEPNGLIFYWFNRLEPYPEEDLAFAEQEQKEKLKVANKKLVKKVAVAVTYEDISDVVRHALETLEIQKLEDLQNELIQLGPDSYLIPKEVSDYIFDHASKIEALAAAGLTIDGFITAVKKYLSSEQAKAFFAAAASIAKSILVNPNTYVYSGMTYVVLNAENFAIVQEFTDILPDIKTLDINGFDEVFDYDTDEDFNFEFRTVDELLTEIKKEQSVFNSAEKTAPQRDPLIIDLENDDIDLTDVENGVYFDLDNNGFAERTAWIGKEDGFLAFDVNGNGVIDNGGELFGDKFIMPDGNVSSTGSEALSSLDENSDDVINADDTVFENLCIWTDADHDGETDEGELVSLTEYGIEFVDLNFISDGTVNTETGTMIAESSFVSLGANITRKISEFWFPVNSADTTHEGEATVGNVPNFDQALYDDLSGELLSLYIDFSYADSISQNAII